MDGVDGRCRNTGIERERPFDDTLKERPFGRGGSFGKPTAYDLEETLIAIDLINDRRAELVTRKAPTRPLRHDSRFVVLKTGDGWRLDSKKKRYIGHPNWQTDIL
jgi:uncharacterized protein